MKQPKKPKKLKMILVIDCGFTCCDEDYQELEGEKKIYLEDIFRDYKEEGEILKFLGIKPKNFKRRDL